MQRIKSTYLGGRGASATFAHQAKYASFREGSIPRTSRSRDLGREIDSLIRMPNYDLHLYTSTDVLHYRLQQEYNVTLSIIRGSFIAIG